MQLVFTLLQKQWENMTQCLALIMTKRQSCAINLTCKIVINFWLLLTGNLTWSALLWLDNVFARVVRWYLCVMIYCLIVVNDIVWMRFILLKCRSLIANSMCSSTRLETRTKECKLPASVGTHWKCTRVMKVKTKSVKTSASLFHYYCDWERGCWMFWF